MIVQKNGFTIQQLPNGIIIMRFDNLLRSTIDEWTAVYRKTCTYGVEQKVHVRSLYDLKLSVPPPYATQVVLSEVRNTPQALTQSLALRVGGQMVATIISVMTRHFTARAQARLRIFQDESLGFEWLDMRTQYITAQEKLPTMPYDEAFLASLSKGQ